MMGEVSTQALKSWNTGPKFSEFNWNIGIEFHALSRHNWVRPKHDPFVSEHLH
ncbi:hypothetical protein DSCW_20260 [Desulfosarcina widdelii]|uniref:Uncharacterized protein n=1 Tax=Desulfosarcina widdelii TaxID=947919 RepID=A0A5K7Z2W8_9BACT|nr:hypothetical protein DSCW_20260 [Desulfosarcina widdelii]